MSFVYKVLPFRGNVETSNPNEVANQLNDLISSQAANGWEFYQINSVNINISPGCLASLFGAKQLATVHDMAIFRQAERFSAVEIREKIAAENEIRAAKEEDPNSPIVIEKNLKAKALIDKLGKIGYNLNLSKITESSEYWEFEYSSNGMKIEITSFEKLQDFANNF
jgi:hypothetical protein